MLYEFGTHYDDWQLADWQIFLDSPMAIEASQVYWTHTELYDEEARADAPARGALPPLPNLELCRTVGRVDGDQPHRAAARSSSRAAACAPAAASSIT